MSLKVHLQFWTLACLNKEPCNPHLNRNAEKRSSNSTICLCIAYGRRQKYLNTLDGGWMSDPSFKKTNIHRVLFYPPKYSFSQKALVSKRKLPGSSKRISCLTAGNSRWPRYHSCTSLHMWIPQRHGLGCSAVPLLSEGEVLIFMPYAHSSSHLQSSHLPPI